MCVSSRRRRSVTLPMSGNTLIMANSQIVANSDKSSAMAMAMGAPSPINSSSNAFEPTSVKSAALALALATGATATATAATSTRPASGNNNKNGKRRQVVHQYHDHSHDMPTVMPHITRGGVKTPFPIRLHNMLSGVEASGQTHIVSWQPHGRSFLVHKTKEFADDVMPTYFNQGKFASFQRQLNLYGFKRLTRGPDTGSYYNELFLRGRPFLAQDISRTKVKGNGARAASNPDAEPNFYGMPSLADDVSGTEMEQMKQQQQQQQQQQQEQLQMQMLAMPQHPFALAQVTRPGQPVVKVEPQEQQPQQALISAEDPEWDSTADYLLDVLDEVLETNMDSLDSDDDSGCVGAVAPATAYAAAAPPPSVANHPGVPTSTNTVMPTIRTGAVAAPVQQVAPVPSSVTLETNESTHAPLPLVSDDEESDAAFHYYQDTLEDILTGVDLESDFELGMILERMVSE